MNNSWYQKTVRLRRTVFLLPTFNLFCLEFKLLACLHAARAEFDATATHRFGKCRPLEIGVFALVAGRVEFGCTNTVRITARDEGSFFAIVTDVR